MVSQKSYQRRSAFQIRIDVLNTIKKGLKKPTRIMYSVNMSWAPLQNVLSSLMSSGFIREIDSMNDKRSPRQYEITQRGLNVLNYLDKEKDLIQLIEIS